MPSQLDFDRLLEPVPEAAGVMVGFPGLMGARVDSENGQLQFAHNKIGVDRHTLHGDITIDSPGSLRQGMMGLPFQVSDNPLGTVPSTLFTPVAAKIIGVDIELIELALIQALITLFDDNLGFEFEGV